MADRWRIYHGDPPDVHWAFLEIDAARQGEWVVDGPPLMRVNPLAGPEPKLCREINQGDRAGLAGVCRRAGFDVQEPLVVGIDPLGFDVRRQYDVVRVPAPAPMLDADAVRQAFEAMCRQAADA